MNRATWKNKKTKKTITGTWQYFRSRDVFLVRFDGCDPETGIERQAIEVYGDEPNVGPWILVEKKIPYRAAQIAHQEET